MLPRLEQSLADSQSRAGPKALPSLNGYVPRVAVSTAHEPREGHDPELPGQVPSLRAHQQNVWPTAKDLLGKQYLLVEFCCSPNSMLGIEAPSRAAVVRLTEDDDARDPDNAKAILSLVAEAKELGVPVALWASIPCTGGSQLQNINVARFGVTDKLRGHWKQFHQLWTSFQRLATAVLHAGGLVAIEWPVRCSYWHDARVAAFLKRRHFGKAIAAACMFGLRPQRDHEPDEYIGKLWRISTNSAELTAALDRRCDGSHRHVETAGKETAATLFYPKGFAAAVHSGLENWAQSRALQLRAERLGRAP